MLRICIDEIFRLPDYDDTLRVLVAKSTDKCPDHPENEPLDQTEWWEEEDDQSIGIDEFCTFVGITSDQLRECLVFVKDTTELKDPGVCVDFTGPCQAAIDELCRQLEQR
jgi:hypothetical protein